MEEKKKKTWETTIVNDIAKFARIRRVAGAEDAKVYFAYIMLAKIYTKLTSLTCKKDIFKYKLKLSKRCLKITFSGSMFPKFVLLPRSTRRADAAYQRGYVKKLTELIGLEFGVPGMKIGEVYSLTFNPYNR